MVATQLPLQNTHTHTHTHTHLLLWQLADEGSCVVVLWDIVEHCKERPFNATKPQTKPLLSALVLTLSGTCRLQGSEDCA